MQDILNSKLEQLKSDIQKITAQLNQLLGAQAICEMLLKENSISSKAQDEIENLAVPVGQNI